MLALIPFITGTKGDKKCNTSIYIYFFFFFGLLLLLFYYYPGSLSLSFDTEERKKNTKYFNNFNGSTFDVIGGIV